MHRDLGRPLRLDLEQGEREAESFDTVDAGHRLQDEGAVGLPPLLDREQRGRVARLAGAREGLLPVVERKVGEVLVEGDGQVAGSARGPGCYVRDERPRSVRGPDAQAGGPARGRGPGPREAVAAESDGARGRQLDRRAEAREGERDAVAGHALRADGEAERPQAERAAFGAFLVEVPPGLPGGEGQRSVVAAEAVRAQRADEEARPGRHRDRGQAPLAGPGRARGERQDGQQEERGQNGRPPRQPPHRTCRRVQHERRTGQDRGEDAGTGESTHAFGNPSSRPASRTRRSSRRTGSPATFEGDPSTVSMKSAPLPSTW